MDTLENLSDALIVSYVKSLAKMFPAKNVIPQKLYIELRELFNNKEYSKCILKIKLHMRIASTLRIGYMREHGALSNLCGHAQRSELRIAVASIMISDRMPMFGTTAFENSTFTMHLDPIFKTMTFTQFLVVIAHELSHLILHSTYHPLRESETATDIAAMLILGEKISRESRSSSGPVYGYLSHRQFEITCFAICEMQHNSA